MVQNERKTSRDLAVEFLFRDKKRRHNEGNISKASVEPHGSFSNASGLDTLPTKVLCRVLSFLDPQDLLFCRLVKKDINRTIKSHFILNATLSEENLSRSWSDGLLLPWSYRRKRNLAHVLETDTIFNKIRYLRVGKLKRNFDGSLKNVSATVQHIEFTKPVARKNIDKIMKECTACTILTVHTSVFIGLKQIHCCCRCPSRKRRPKYAEIQTVANQLSKLRIVLDEATSGAKLPCVLPYSLIISLNAPTDDALKENCEIQFIRQGSEDIPTEVHKTWVIDDQIIDLYSRPDCLRKLTYFSRTTQAELREIKVKFVPDLSLPATVQCAKMIHHPAFYPQLKKYPTGPFNGAILTYFTTNRKQIMTYRPVHISSSVLIMTFPDAALVLVSERRSAVSVAE